MQRSFLLLGVAVFALVCSFTTVSAVNIRLSHASDLVLTHATQYSPPPFPSQGLDAYIASELELIESFSRVSPLGPNDTSKHCSHCQLLVQVAEWVAQSNSSMTFLEAILAKECATIAPNQTWCPILVDILGSLAEALPKQLQHAGLYEPVRVCSFLGECKVNCCADQTTPNQISLGFDKNSSSMHVSWVTGGDAPSVVYYSTSSPNSLDQQASGYQLTYTQGGWVGQIHRVLLADLPPATTVYYAVGSPSATVYNFTTIDPLNLAPSYTIAVFGDMGAADNAWSPMNFAYMNAATQIGMYQQVIHIGDISYADGYEGAWDEFFTELQPTMTQLPYQVIPGNHEIVFNFSGYSHRFFTAGLSSVENPPLSLDPTQPSGTNLWSSYDVGCVHFVSLNSESPLDVAYISDFQLQWLEADLAATRTKMDRAADAARASGTPVTQNPICSASSQTFIIAYLHRPLYCTDASAKHHHQKPDNNCGKEAKYLQSRVESLFFQHGVDLVMYGHMHNYESTVPMYQNQSNPLGPVYITNGAGGNREGIENSWMRWTPEWVQLQSSSVGLGEIEIVNSTLIEWSYLEQLSTNTSVNPFQNVQLADSIQFIARERGAEQQAQREAEWRRLEQENTPYHEEMEVQKKVHKKKHHIVLQ